MNPLDDLGDLAEEFGYEGSRPAPVPAEPFAGLIPAALPSDPRERFAAFTKALEDIEAERKRLNDAAQATYVKELETLWRQVKRRGKKGFNRHAAEKELGTTATELAERHVSAHKTVIVPAYDHAKNAAEEGLIHAAAEITVRPSETDHWHFGDVYPDGYRTQGGGALRYAEARAEIIAADVRAAGVRAEVRKHVDSGNLPFFAVYVWCVEADLGIVRKKPGLSMRDQVQLAWKLGANPRVYWPFLPHGYEESHGIDFFGNDKVPVQIAMKPVYREPPDGAPLDFDEGAPAQKSEPEEPEPV